AISKDDYERQIAAFYDEAADCLAAFLDAADQRAPGGVLEDEVNRARLLDVLGLPATSDEATLEAALLASGDRRVHDEIGRQQRILGTALANAVNVLNPSALVLGGFLASLLVADPDGLAEAVAHAALESSWEGTRLVPAALGSARLLIGAAEIAFAPLIADPGAVVAAA
ncbi:MAG: hypothetical protein J7480_09880, partial [Microbacteriaceae bacterium]|nr:hypothetical protein [Microbacteriaceae bacterium]